jgi:DUF1680 family protein
MVQACEGKRRKTMKIIHQTKYMALITVLLSVSGNMQAQKAGLTDTHASKYAVMSDVSMDATRWTNGFWGERFGVLGSDGVKNMWKTWCSDTSHGFYNFQVAAGLVKGEHHGPPFHDGDMYKWLEATAAVYAVTKDPELDKIMDKFIAVVVKAQRADGYIHTPVIIAELNKGIDTHSGKDNTVIGTKTGSANDGAFGNRLNFETYNLGHLMTAGIVHYRATGKKTLLNAAIKATDFLCGFYEKASAELARNAICPSHYMGVAEMYRQTGNPRYLALAKNLIDIRGMVKNGTDDNQDRVPFRKQYTAMGHAVRSNYLYAGAADLYLEDGEEQLMKNLTSIWNDITTRKMYITGACGALYDGTSPDGTCYEPDSIQKVHQSYGRPYQLPNSTAHNETCANIGNMLFNWRMLEATGNAKYADIVETCLYNSVLSGISLDGKRYFYTNPMRMSADLPYKLRWPKERTEYISCFCCPPNTLRTLCESQNYAYSASTGKLWVNLYGDNTLTTSIDGIGTVGIKQTSNYPWDGDVCIEFTSMKGKNAFSLNLRIPGWCSSARVMVNGQDAGVKIETGTYASVHRQWKKGDKVELLMDMPARLVEANPLVEEARGQIAVQRGPIVYCLESQDLTSDTKIDDVAIPSTVVFKPEMMEIDGSHVASLVGTAVKRTEGSWQGTLYRALSTQKENITIRLVPYYAWGNRGKGEMTVWMPLDL